MRQFGGGASNLTYSLRDGSHDLILRRPPSGQKAKGAHDMGREYRIQDGLADVFPLVPEMVALCEDESVIGSEFYVMQRVDGLIPRRDLPPGVDLDEEQARDAVHQRARRADRPAPGRRRRDAAGLDEQGRGVRRAADLRLVEALPQRAHRGRSATTRR